MRLASRYARLLSAVGILPAVDNRDAYRASVRYAVCRTDEGTWAVYDTEKRYEVDRRDVQSEAVMVAECMENHGRVWRR